MLPLTERSKNRLQINVICGHFLKRSPRTVGAIVVKADSPAWEITIFYHPLKHKYAQQFGEFRLVQRFIGTVLCLYRTGIVMDSWTWSGQETSAMLSGQLWYLDRNA